MRTNDASRTQGAAGERLLHALIRRQGVKEGEYALFFVTGEGEFLPVAPPGDPVE